MIPIALTRRAALCAPLALIARPALAAAPLRIGVQKYGTLVILRERGTLEPALAASGIGVTWHEFPAGPQLLEALAAEAIDFGIAGEAPPVFAQAAGTAMVYVGAEPAGPTGEAILVPQGSPIRTLADLRGRTVALNKGSNVHYLLVQALGSAGLKPADITLAYLPPADARAAFERGAVDAWAIWDPFLAAAQDATGARVLADGAGLAANRQFFLANRRFATERGGVLRTLLGQIGETDAWARAHQDEVAALLTASLGLPASVVARVVARLPLGVGPMTTEITADQQRIADTFLMLRLIPEKLVVASAVWSVPA